MGTGSINSHSKVSELGIMQARVMWLENDPQGLCEILLCVEKKGKDGKIGYEKHMAYLVTFWSRLFVGRFYIWHAKDFHFIFCENT